MSARSRKQYRDVGMDDFFSDKNIAVSRVPVKKKSKFASLIMFLVASIVGGVLFAIPPVMGASAVAKLSVPVVDMWRDLPSTIDNIAISQRSKLYDVNGNVFAEVWDENRIVLDSLDQVSEYAKKGLVATEDRKFYEHQGIDYLGTARSAVRGTGGGSGITQQLVKNLQFFNLAGKDKKEAAVEATIGRKVRELKLALQYEKDHTKDEILLGYFNVVSFGAPNIYSIEAAAQYFFGIPAKDLNLAQASVLVGTVQNPVSYNLNNPKNEEKYKARQKTVLNSMVTTGVITQEEADAAYAEPLNFVFKKNSAGNCATSAYPFYCEYVMDSLRNSPRLGATPEERQAILSRGGLQINTYMDPALMKIVNDQVRNDYGNNNRVAVPVSIVSPATGGVAAIGVNRDYGDGPGQTTINLPLNAAASGSVFKMITLGAAMENGFKEGQLTFGSQCPWRKPGFDTPRGGVKNSVSCGYQGGLMDYREATAKSSNTWFSELISRVGVDKTKEFAKSVGLNAPDSITKRSVSYTLGVTEDSTVDVAAAFATFTNGGIYCPPNPVKSLNYADGTSPVLPDDYDPAQDACRRVMSPQEAGVVLKAMRANMTGEVPGAMGMAYAVPGADTVGKTGTNQLYNSTWVQLSQKYVAYGNQYDPNTLKDGIGVVKFRGRNASWKDHTAAITVSDIMKQVNAVSGGLGNLTYDTPDDSRAEVPVEKRELFTVPSFMGMSPENAVAVAESYGLTVHVSKETVPAQNNYPAGVIGEQSLEAGNQLPYGTKTELILKVTK